MSRSDLVYRAELQERNRFALVRKVTKAARVLHRGERKRLTRMADTINETFLLIAMPEKVDEEFSCRD